jgi:hypothetical protein
MHPGNQKHMPFVYGIDIKKRDRSLGFENPDRWDLAVNDLAKDAMRIVW